MKRSKTRKLGWFLFIQKYLQNSLGEATLLNLNHILMANAASFHNRIDVIHSNVKWQKLYKHVV